MPPRNSPPSTRRRPRSEPDAPARFKGARRASKGTLPCWRVGLTKKRLLGCKRGSAQEVPKLFGGKLIDELAAEEPAAAFVLDGADDADESDAGGFHGQ